MKTLKELKEDIEVIKACRLSVKIARKAGRIPDTRFLAHIASVPEWTIVIFNRKWIFSKEFKTQSKIWVFSFSQE